MNDTQLHQDFGRLQGEFNAMKEEVTIMRKKMDDVHKILLQAQGGWKMMVIVGTISSAITGVMLKGWALLHGN